MRRAMLLFVIVVSAAVAAAVATFLTQKPKLQAMSEEELRAFLGDRLGTRVSDEQIDKLAAAITARLGQADAPADTSEESAGAADEAGAEATGE